MGFPSGGLSASFQIVLGEGDLSAGMNCDFPVVLRGQRGVMKQAPLPPADQKIEKVQKRGGSGVSKGQGGGFCDFQKGHFYLNGDGGNKPGRIVFGGEAKGFVRD